MNPSQNRSNSLDNNAIDRLVDGELNDNERSELLLALENEPDGWRRCALAFLEDQAWRSALKSRSSTNRTTGPVVIAPTVARPSKPWLLRTLMAASIIGAAFAAGFAAGGISRGSPQVELVKSEPAKPVERATKAQREPIREVGWINIVDPSSGESPSQRVPILSGPGVDERWLREKPPTVPDYIRARLERQGYQVEEKRKLVSVTLEDGRRVSIPVDEVALDYVGQNPL
jgi:hypothetical protein